jgi:NitT/TauT family transport system permease protein
MGAELIFVIQGRDGLGHLLAIGREFADVAQVVAVMIVMVMIGMIVDRWVFARLQRAVHARFGLA